MMTNESFNQHVDLVQINDSNEKNAIIIDAHQLNQYYQTLLGNPFERWKYYNSITGQYQFYRTPGMIRYIIDYYLHRGCLSTNVICSVEILYEELKFFRLNTQVIYDVISNVITRKCYIPSGRYRRAFWLVFKWEKSKRTIGITHGLMTISSIITSFILIEILNHSSNEYRLYMKRTLITESMILIYSYLELSIEYFIHPKFPTTTWFFILINTVSLIPFSLFLFIWSIPPLWLYSSLVIQCSTRLLRSIRLSHRAYRIIHALTEHMEIFVQTFQIIALIILFCTLLLMACEKVSSPVEFLPQKTIQSFNEMIWITINAFTSLGEGRNRPMTHLGLMIEFFTCFLGILLIPQLVQTIYTIVSNTIDQDMFTETKPMRNYLVFLEDEYGNVAIGRMEIDQNGHGNLPEIVLEKKLISEDKLSEYLAGASSS